MKSLTFMWNLFKLRSQNADRRWAAVIALRDMGDARAVVPLTHALHDADDRVRFAAIQALHMLGASSALIGALDHHDPTIQAEACASLGHLKAAAAVTRLVALIDHDDPCIAANAAFALGEIGDDTASSAVMRLFDRDSIRQDEGNTLRVARALAQFGHLQFLERLMHDRNSNKYSCAQELVDIAGMDALPVLTHAIEDSERYDAACYALSQYIPKLRERMEHDQDILDSKLRPASLYLSDIVSEARDYNDQRVQYAIGALGSIGDSSAIAVIEKFAARLEARSRHADKSKRYVRTSLYSGWTSDHSDNISASAMVNSAIESIRERNNRSTACPSK